MSVRRLLLFLLLLCPPLLPAQTPATGRFAAVLTIDGPIGPATADYVHGALARAQQNGASVVVLRLDTPGGLDTAMRAIIHDILASPVPVVGYVAPNGARAASAGTYILYACQVAAMAPATNLGAATPVQIGGLGGGDKALKHKIVNDAVAYIRGLAQLRGRNAQWAEKAVREAASLDAPAALKEHVIDLIAPDTATLLKEIDGRQVTVSTGRVTLHTAGLPRVHAQPDWRTRLLAILTDPNVAYILMLIGIYGLIFEFSNPGTILPGVAGAICLLLALFAFQVLPVNYAGFALILLGAGMMVAEAFVPSFGALGIGGVIAFVVGSVMLIDTNAPGFGISPALIGAFALFSVLLFVVLIGVVVRAHRKPVVSGAEELAGAAAEALADFQGRGPVRAHGELWQAHCDTPVRKGQPLRITGIDGLTLEVAPEPPRKGEG